jgi:hypothetical protein
VEFLSYNHNVAVDLICESDFQCCKITNIEIKDERTDGATAWAVALFFINKVNRLTWDRKLPKANILCRLPSTIPTHFKIVVDTDNQEA